MNVPVEILSNEGLYSFDVFYYILVMLMYTIDH
jgi:hypothetical protein